MSALLERSEAIRRAKELLREHLAKHPDSGIRMLNEMAELPDDLPHVVSIADMLQANAARASEQAS